ncbi:type II toxin-antitoxin system CcdA family antitoxin [Microvirga arsenatis]|uniref:Post-segregation antitoxin CcdA n=1 Tax=Microvirga arsenatis TaxID=2692265 RepID=A0ABW9Z383_9HYPH|nr:type II toxin-antitoxin system CcdA family antitoxin [Microvirga arsenatis]NBJ13688.1 post-segregation antitoxin CcdA [Microvirga arsenatis]NBJ27162.1 post-segregation antitoxin CcdA [Microvirga arsenatis]
MSERKTNSPIRRSKRVTLSVELVREARALGVNISQACEAGLARAVAEARGSRWLEENREAIEAHNALIERDGLPLDEFRQF